MPPLEVSLVYKCLRLLMRDQHFLKKFYSLEGVRALSEHLQTVVRDYQQRDFRSGRESVGNSRHTVQILKEMSSGFTIVFLTRKLLCCCDLVP